jgi:molybdopterin converting factor small subunit
MQKWGQSFITADALDAAKGTGFDMKIQVRSGLNIAEIMDCRSVGVELPEKATLKNLLDELSAIYGRKFHDAVCDEFGYPESVVAVLINGVSAAAIGGAGIKLKDGDDVLILPVISGG